MRFSDRKGFTNPSRVIQVGAANDALRSSLWNCLYFGLWRVEQRRDYDFENLYRDLRYFTGAFWMDYLKKPADTRPVELGDMLGFLRKIFLEGEWYEVYNVLEFALELHGNPELNAMVNSILERELAGYRYIQGVITDITTEEEVQLLESALAKEVFPGVRGHLKRALELLSHRERPDYRNSIKESISAVESAAKAIAGSQKGTLADALKSIERKGQVHPALKEGFLKLYGYTSDEGGIRHAMLEEPNVTATDAKFFLLACTSFIGYLKGKMA